MLYTYRTSPARVFFGDLQEEIVRLAAAINQVSEDGDLDGFSVDAIDDGWVKYRGMSWGIAIQHEPDIIVMTWGPDGPFVGTRVTLVPTSNGPRELVWQNPDDEAVQFTSAKELAKYGLAALADMVGDRLPVVR